MTADTETAIGSAYTMPEDGRAIELRFCFYQGVIDKSTTTILYLSTNRKSGPFEFAVGGSIGITTTSGATGPNIVTESIPIDIPLTKGEIVTIKGKASEALEEATVSMKWIGQSQ